MSKARIYVGCSLTHAPAEFRVGVESLKKILRSEDYEVMDFMWVTDHTASPKKIFEWDINNCVKNCDGLVAICDHPSLGLGYEMAEAVNLGKPVLALAEEGTRISNLVLGAAEALPNVEFKRYKDVQLDIAPLVNDWLASQRLA